MIRAAMDYYAELGVPRGAPVEDIRRAWRNLARLLHPDQQQDDNLRLLAEVQMKRLNEICALLTDPVQRLHYDQSLIARPRPAAAPFWTETRRKWVLAAAVAVIALSTAALYPRGEAPRLAPQPPKAVTVAPTPTPARRRTVRPTVLELPQRPREVTARVPSARLMPPPEVAAEAPTLPAPTYPTSAAVAPPPAPEPVEGVAGDWFYAVQKAPPGAVLCPPEFIELFITETAGTLHGRYRARYKVGDRPISGDVHFFFDGPPGGDPVVLPWTGPGGSSGEVRLKLLAEGTLQVSWQATQLGAGMDLASGTALLTRRLTR